MLQYERLTDPPEGVVIEATHLPTSASFPSVGVDPGPSGSPLSAESIPLFIDDDDVPFEADYQSYQAKVRLFEASHDFTGLPVLSSLPDEPAPDPPPAPAEEGPPADLPALFGPPSPQVLLKNELDLIFLDEDFPEKVLVPPKLIDNNIPTLPNSPHEPVLPKNAMFPTNRMVVEARMAKAEWPPADGGAPERTGPQGWGKPRVAPRPHVPGLRSAPQFAPA
jgi:hypothetical protein